MIEKIPSTKKQITNNIQIRNSNDSNKTDNSQIVRFPLPWWEGIKREGGLLTFYDAVMFGIWVIVI